MVRVCVRVYVRGVEIVCKNTVIFLNFVNLVSYLGGVLCFFFFRILYKLVFAMLSQILLATS